MGYGRATSTEKLDPKVVQALAQRLGLKLSSEELKALTASLSNQLAAIKAIERFDLKHTVPVLRMDARWHE